MRYSDRIVVELYRLPNPLLIVMPERVIIRMTSEILYRAL